MESFRHEENPNLCKLEEILENYLVSKGEDSRGIVFVKTRALAEALASWLNRCGKDEIARLKSTIFTGTNASESEGGMTQAQQDACVDSFRKGKVRLLIATSVAEEGIDVPECNLVIKYNHVGNEISTIQTKGRSRKRGGRSILLAMPSIRERETVNRYRATLVFNAVDIIQDMELSERRQRILDLQKEALNEQELDELMEQNARRLLKDKKFKMYCKICRKTCVSSDYVKTIFGTHRVVTDWNIFNHINVRGHAVKYIDDLRFIGSVRCKAFVEKQATCNGPLGMLVVYKATCFLALGVKNFVFVEENEKTPQPFDQWKKVKYRIGEIDIADIKRYIEDSHRDRADSNGEAATITDSSKDKQVKEERLATKTLESIQPEENSNQYSQSCMDEGAVGCQDIPYQVAESPRTGTDILSKSRLTTLSDKEGSYCNPGVSSEKKENFECSYKSKHRSGSASVMSNLSTFQPGDDHHQTKLVSHNTVIVNRQKFQERCEDKDSEDIDYEDNSTTGNDDAFKILNEAPPLDSMDE